MGTDAQKTILLVEDEGSLSASGKLTLETLGYSVETADSGNTAVAFSKGSRGVDLVLMDLDLGAGMDGVDTAEAILRERDLPLLFLSDQEDAEFLRRAETVLSYGYVAKSSCTEVLDASIKLALKRFASDQRRKQTSRRFHSALNTELEKTKDELSASEFRYRQLFENSPFALLGFDGGGVITACNQSFLRDAKLAREQVVGLCLLELPDEELVSKAKAALSGSYGFYEGDYHLQESAPTQRVRILFTPLTPETGGNAGGLAIIEDLTDRKRIEAELYRGGQIIDRGNSHFSLLAENLPIAVSMFDAESYRLQYVNRALQVKSGLPREKLIGTHLRDVGGEDNFPLVQKHTEIARAGQPVAYENYFDTVLGRRWFQVNYIPVPNNHGKVTSILVFNLDLTEHKKIQEELKALVEEKDFILREVHHRIKNHMNVVKGILFLQAQSLQEPSAIAALEDAQNRIQSMMMLYSKLYESDNTTSLSSQSYLSALVDEVVGNFPNCAIVQVEKHIDDFALGMKTIQPLSILLNELLTNIMKYAFVGRNGGQIRVSASQEEGTTSVMIQDDGVGMPESVDFNSSPGFGLTLVSILAKQLKGSIEVERKNGTKITLEFEQ